MEALKQLARDILQRYPDISSVNVLGHAEISPGRKSDPGAAFPGKTLYEAGIGAWYDEATMQSLQERLQDALPSRGDVIARLKVYGYDTSSTVSESAYRDVLRAFQLHFRHEKYDGVLDAQTAAILYALVAKYFPGK